MPHQAIVKVPVGLDARGRSISLARRPLADGSFEYALYRMNDVSSIDADEFYGLPAQLLLKIGQLAVALDENEGIPLHAELDPISGAVTQPLAGTLDEARTRRLRSWRHGL